MSKDPAVLFYINDWLISTSEMDADCRGWYLNLLLHNYDKNDLPNDIEKLAVLAGVKFSEFDRFKQVFEQVLKQKFEQTEGNRLTNLRASKIMRSRETFKDKRSTAGKMSYLMKYFAKNYTKEYKNNKLNEFVKKNINTDIDIKNEQVLKQVFEHLFELYRNENENDNNDNNNTNTWRTDFLIYQKECNAGYNKCWNDDEWWKKTEELYPSYNLERTIKKSHAYWSSEEGWRKKKASKTKDIDWKATIIKSLDISRSYYTREEEEERKRNG
jgi:hypothetical protein